MSELKICPHCGERTGVPDRVSLWGVYDNHTFTRYEAKSVDELIDAWRQSLKEDDPAISLCPIIVLIGKKEVRRVGEMLHPDYRNGVPKDESAVQAFRETALADPDISRILAKA